MNSRCPYGVLPRVLALAAAVEGGVLVGMAQGRAATSSFNDVLVWQILFLWSIYFACLRRNHWFYLCHLYTAFNYARCVMTCCPHDPTWTVYAGTLYAFLVSCLGAATLAVCAPEKKQSTRTQRIAPEESDSEESSDEDEEEEEEDEEEDEESSDEEDQEGNEDASEQDESEEDQEGNEDASEQDESEEDMPEELEEDKEEEDASEQDESEEDMPELEEDEEEEEHK